MKCNCLQDIIFLIFHALKCNTFVIVTARKRSLGQGNIFTSVCQEFCSQGGCLVLWGLCSRGVPGPKGVCSRGGCLVLGGGLLRGSALGGVCSQGVPGGDPPPLTATAAGGTHPTGMHSCFTFNFHSQRKFSFSSKPRRPQNA